MTAVALVLADLPEGFFSPPVLSIVLGGLLMLIGIVGGGFELKEVKIPQVNKIPRFLAVVCGGALVAIGLGLHATSASNPINKPQVSSAESDNASKRQDTSSSPSPALSSKPEPPQSEPPKPEETKAPDLATATNSSTDSPDPTTTDEAKESSQPLLYKVSIEQSFVGFENDFKGEADWNNSKLTLFVPDADIAYRWDMAWRFPTRVFHLAAGPHEFKFHIEVLFKDNTPKFESDCSGSFHINGPAKFEWAMKAKSGAGITSCYLNKISGS